MEVKGKLDVFVLLALLTNVDLLGYQCIYYNTLSHFIQKEVISLFSYLKGLNQMTRQTWRFKYMGCEYMLWCKNDKQNRPKPCFDRFHAKKNSVGNWIWNLREFQFFSIFDISSLLFETNNESAYIYRYMCYI